MKQDELILDADSDNPIDLSDESVRLNPTTDVTHSILEPMKIEPLRLPQHIIEQMKASYEEVCVNDFKDIYHMSEEDRKQTFQFYEIFKELSVIKIKHRTLNSYVEAYRVMMKVLNAVAEVNGVYEKDAFIKRVLKGKIKVSGLKIPKYIGRNKKDINWELVAKYILDTELDPDDLVKSTNETFFDLVTDDDISEAERLVGQDLNQYMDEQDSEITEEYLEEVDLDEVDITGSNVLRPFTKKEQKKLFKDSRVLLMGVKDSRKFASSNGHRIYSSFAYELTQDAFAEVRERDEESGRLKVPEFKGDAFNQRDVDKYLAVLEEYERKNTQVEVNGRFYSLEDADEMSLKSLLENNGFDIRKFYSYKSDEKKMIRQKKKDEKKIKRLKKMLRDTKKRYEERDSKGGVNTKKEKKGKKKKKAEKSFNENIIGNRYDSIEDYVSAMESWGDD